MKPVSLIFLYLLFSLSVSVNAQTFSWATRVASDGFDYVQGMVQDNNANLYQLISVDGSAQFGSIAVSVPSAVLSKCDSSGNYLMVKSWSDFLPSSIVINSQYGILITGQLFSTVFDGWTVINPSGIGTQNTAIAALYDTTLTLQWLVVFDIAQYSKIFASTFLNSGFVIGGTAPPGGQVGSMVFSNVSDGSFYASLSNNGVIMDARLISESSLCKGIATGKDGSTYLYQRYFNSISLAGGTTIFNPQGGFGYVCTRNDSSGNLIWNIELHDNDPGTAYRNQILASLPDGNIVFQTTVKDTLFFRSDTIPMPGALLKEQLTAVDTSGTVIWRKVLQANISYLGVFSLDSTGFYISGTPSFIDSLDFGGLMMYNQGFMGLHLVKHNVSGIPLWGKTIRANHLGGFCCESIAAVTQDASNNLYITGIYHENSYFDALSLGCVLMPSGLCSAYEVFTTKLNDITLNTPVTLPLIPNMSIYPNPSNGNFHIEFAEETTSASEYIISDLSGKTIIRNTFSAREFDISMQGYAPGTYFFSASHNGLPTQRKLVVIR